MPFSLPLRRKTSILKKKKKRKKNRVANDQHQQINDEFLHVCGNVRLWSFFEGVPTGFGLLSSLIVEKQSAILGTYLGSLLYQPQREMLQVNR